MEKIRIKSKWFIVMLFGIAISLCLLFGFSLNTISVFAAENEQGEGYYDEIISDFADDIVLASLTRRFSMSNKTLDVRDFGLENITNFRYIIKELYPTYNEAYPYESMPASQKEIAKLTDESAFRQIIVLTISNPGKENVFATIEQLKRLDFVESASPNYQGHIFATPNDPILSEQWAVNKIGLPSAWDIAKGVSAINVGIVDTGIAAHTDLGSNLVAGWNFVGDNSNATDTHGHGSHVAGIVGALGDNNIGISGANWTVSLVPLKVSTNGLIDSNDVIEAINYARTNNIPIVNCSFGIPNSAELFNAYNLYEGLTVCAAGNEDNNNNTNPVFPASYQLENIISVGASDSNDNRSNWNDFSNLWGFFGLLSSKSNYGSTSVHIFAPGTDILSTVPTNNYSKMSGTSMASPYVAGVAALLLSHDSRLTAENIKTAILDNATPVSALSGLCTTGGRLNANAAIRSIGYNTVTIGNDEIRIDSPCFTPTCSLVIPEFLNGRTVTQISASAFTNQNSLTSVTIPSTITTIGSDAFKNTNNASIYLEDRATSPNTFNVKWNVSNNPVYLDGVLCNHTNTTYQSITSGQHGDLCDDCRTTTNIGNHTYTSSHTWVNTNQHRSYCGCGDNNLMGHVVASGWNGGNGFVQFSKGKGINDIVSAIYIEKYIGNGSYVLSNGVIVLSEIDEVRFYNETLTIIDSEC